MSSIDIFKKQFSMYANALFPCVSIDVTQLPDKYYLGDIFIQVTYCHNSLIESASHAETGHRTNVQYKGYARFSRTVDLQKAVSYPREAAKRLAIDMASEALKLAERGAEL